MKDCFRSAWVVAGCVAAMLSAAVPAGAQDLEDWQEAELRTLVAAVDQALRGERAPDAGAITYLPSYLKGAEDVTYVPFTLLNRSGRGERCGQRRPGQHRRLRGHGRGGLDGPELRERLLCRRPTSGKAAACAFPATCRLRAATTTSTSPSATASTATHRWRHPSMPSGGKGGQPVVPPITLLRERVTIPDLWNDDLQTSSILLTQGRAAAAAGPDAGRARRVPLHGRPDPGHPPAERRLRQAGHAGLRVRHLQHGT